MKQEPSLDLSKIRKKLEALSGPHFWKSLEEVAETEEFQEFLKHEYPYESADFSAPISRRNFLKFMGASLAMAGLAGCSPAPIEKIVAYHAAQNGMVPGKPLFFATGMVWNGHAVGLLAESNMGRPSKLEGNPEHPDSLGATLAFHQASILDLYDPDRSKVIMHQGRISTWDHFVADVGQEISKQKRIHGASLRILTEPVISPTLGRQIQACLKKFPQAKWHQYDPAWPNDQARQGQKAAFGEYANPLYDFKKADVILSLDSDFLINLPGSIRYARDFISKRQAQQDLRTLSRLYTVESSPTLAGAIADHRLPLAPSEVEVLTGELAKRLGIVVEAQYDKTSLQQHRSWLDAVIQDLKDHKGTSLVIPGEGQSALVHALVHSMNQILGNVDQTVRYIKPIELSPVEYTASLAELNEDMKSGKVDFLVILGPNPVYTAPRDFHFSQHLKHVPKIAHLGLYQDETAALSDWHIPQTHYLEIFSDALASDGTVTMIQPLIAPLYGGKSEHEILELLLEKMAQTHHDMLEETWKNKTDLNKAIHDGLIMGSAFESRSLKAKSQYLRSDLKHLSKLDVEKKSGYEIVFRPDASVWDGRFANNGWLQELPKALTKLTWDNAALISPKTAEKIGLTHGDGIFLECAGQSLEAPVWIVPGHAERSLTLPLGYGRNFIGRIGSGIGFNAYSFRHSQSPLTLSGVEIRKSGRKFSLASTQLHNSMEGRELVRRATVEEFLDHPDFAQGHHDHEPLRSLYPEHRYDGNAWGMTINLNSCIGCNSCVVACQSENNSPVVGKEEVLKGREMQWLRIDRYYEGNLDNPVTHHQPVLCMHCENAPCEPVCPVGATVHSSEGLNEMVYNRCVGTKYCSNNCPYKVRRFNFFEYADKNSESLKLMRNPEVTIRARGVMEKCTFCVQRISASRIDAAKDNRPIRDGEIVTACQAACPTQAIVFGNINDQEAKVTKLKASPLNYGLLAELNTRPRVSYLAHVVNPNPKLKPA